MGLLRVERRRSPTAAKVSFMIVKHRSACFAPKIKQNLDHIEKDTQTQPSLLLGQMTLSGLEKEQWTLAV